MSSSSRCHESTIFEIDTSVHIDVRQYARRETVRLNKDGQPEHNTRRGECRYYEVACILKSRHLCILRDAYLFMIHNLDLTVMRNKDKGPNIDSVINVRFFASRCKDKA